jgi:hypothetical protein
VFSGRAGRRNLTNKIVLILSTYSSCICHKLDFCQKPLLCCNHRQLIISVMLEHVVDVST